MKLPKILKTASSLTPRHWILLAQAWSTLLWWRIAIHFIPTSRLQGSLLRVSKRISARTGITAPRIAWAISVASRFIPQATCLVRAIATKRLLAYYGYPSDLAIGVAKATAQAKAAPQNFAAHAWIECEGSVLIGGSVTEYSRILTWN